MHLASQGEPCARMLQAVGLLQQEGMETVGCVAGVATCAAMMAYYGLRFKDTGGETPTFTLYV